ncbi:MAG: septal ring lytic transglycosylase RlpA family lipoprotein [Flavobacterium sp. BFFFF1]|uniref:septal ring lytic transglycosylase RlpA family protein n=1 Tax=unclassified Flavobacterium TaxID=196869 RepID=UPI000BCEFA9F|nr:MULTISPECIES: septal ring lytic transglycosylase RlpA family protein [unclassified Flavobacterium]OYU81484.1 MAG: septal ring lytic transglycosylase RlpA family lipoprotein [Flavobacterium sp. BFFFF1]
MKHKTTILLLALFTVIFSFGFSSHEKTADKFKQDKKVQDSLKRGAQKDSLKLISKFKLVKKNAHASYYADKLNGRRTASGKRFDNSKYTAAHRRFPFGTKLRITNEANGKSVVVEVNDRGPFTRGRDIDLTKKAFMEIASSKYGGSLVVTIEEVQ